MFVAALKISPQAWNPNYGHSWSNRLNFYCTIVLWNSALVTPYPSDQRWTTMTETLLLIVDQYLHACIMLISGRSQHFTIHQWFNLCFQGGGAVKPTVWPVLPEEECKQTGGPASIQTKTPPKHKSSSQQMEKRRERESVI